MFGSHLSIAGGWHLALLEAQRLGFDTVQIFTKNQQQWVAKPMDPAAVAEFKQVRAAWDAQRPACPLVAHDSYLINLATTDPELRAKSMQAFAIECARCDTLGIEYLVTHPGSHGGAGEADGLARVAAALNEILAQPYRVRVCIETTAGQGTSLGWRFEHLATLLEAVRYPLATCFDTAHVLAAGYDLTHPEATAATLAEYDRLVGLKNIAVFHLNDSRKPLGSRVDRHEHIGRGCVGLGAFEVIVNHPQFQRVPKILETAKEKDPAGQEWDALNLATLKRLQRG